VKIDDRRRYFLYIAVYSVVKDAGPSLWNRVGNGGEAAALLAFGGLDLFPGWLLLFIWSTFTTLEMMPVNHRRTRAALLPTQWGWLST
jgi:hypothetical protein